MIRVIGVGSPWGDDQAGWLAAEALRGLFEDDRVEVKTLDRPGPALCEHWQRNDSVVLLDAVRAQGEIGRIHCVEGAAIADLGGASLSSHGFGVAAAVALAAALEAMPRRLCLLGLEVSDSGRSAGLSAEAERCVPQLTAAAHAQVTTWLND
ncbi:MAG: hydrogenase maturation protease [Gammaproteobacteria bacterium]|nr:hydrogenase maturation protease [Gammaproteobacteria bacterium]